MSPHPHPFRRLSVAPSWLLVALDVIQYGGIALIAIPIAFAAERLARLAGVARLIRPAGERGRR